MVTIHGHIQALAARDVSNCLLQVLSYDLAVGVLYPRVKLGLLVI